MTRVARTEGARNFWEIRILMRIRYVPVEDRIETYAVCRVENGQPDFLIGYVNRSETASRTARLRGDPQIKTVPGRKRVETPAGICWARSLRNIIVAWRTAAAPDGDLSVCCLQQPYDR
jgi:hypothetical protein